MCNLIKFCLLAWIFGFLDVFSSKDHGDLTTPEGMARGMIGIIYNGDYQTLLHTKYRSSGPSGFREDFSHCKSMETVNPLGMAKFDPRGMAGTIFVENH